MTHRPSAPTLLTLGRASSTAAAIAFVVACWQLTLVAWSADDQVGSGAERVRHLLIDAAICVALWLPSRYAAGALCARLPREARTSLVEITATTLLFTGLLVPAAWLREVAFSTVLGSLSGAAPVEARFLCSSADALPAEGGESFAAVAARAVEGALLLQAPVWPTLAVLAFLRGGRLRDLFTLRRMKVAGALALVSLAVAIMVPTDPPPPTQVPPLVAGCPEGVPVRSWAISAIQQPIPLNRFGDYDPLGVMYVLDQNLDAVRQQAERPITERASIGLRKDAIQPLVIRANLGECVEIRFTNRLPDGPASLHIHGLAHTVENAGGQVGLNSDTFAEPGETLTYRLPMPTSPEDEGAYYFHDGGASRQRVVHGLFGVLVAEPAGSRHLDTETGQPLTDSNWEAIIAPAEGPSFREFVVIYHEVGDEKFGPDELGLGQGGILNANGDHLPLVSDFLEIYRPGSRALNYRSEPFHRRLQLEPDESMGYASYTFGDPATPIPQSYLGDPAKTRLVHAGTETFHVHHLHGGATRWRLNPRSGPSEIARGLDKAPDTSGSNRRDAQTLGPGTAFDLEHECGSGGCQAAAGDFLYHCHIGHHYNAGMWSFWRVFDTRQPHLAPLPDRPPPPDAVNSLGLVGRNVEGRTLVPRAQVTDPKTQQALEDFIERQLPPPGVRLDKKDATVWDWVKVSMPQGPLYLGEPEDTAVWPNFRSETPGQRPEIQFNPENGRYAWPLLRPHLANRPPFPGNGHSGTPWLGKTGTPTRPDGLCPTDQVLPNPRRKTHLFPISSISATLQVTPDEVDRDGQIYILNDERQSFEHGTKDLGPLVIRTNAGDCAEVLFTNELVQRAETGEPMKANLHSHLVQFDPQGSDGVVAGLSWEQSVYPYESERRKLARSVSAGASSIRVTRVDRLRPGIWIGIGLGKGLCTESEGAAPAFCTEIRRITSIQDRTLFLDEPLRFAHDADEAVGVEFTRADWYSDVNTGTVFFHTHVDFHQWHRGLFGMHIVEPPGATYHDPVTGNPVRSGAIVDVHVPADAPPVEGIRGSFREAALAVSEEILSARDYPARAMINLRAEPLDKRRPEEGFAFSSVTHGDPITPTPRAYLGDPMIIRLLGLTENVSAFRVSGTQFPRDESSLAGTGAEDALVLGVSERFDLPLFGGGGGVAQRAGDHLYYNTVARFLEAGAWGLVRVHDTLQPDLQPLPGRPPPVGAGGAPLQVTGGPPPSASGPGNPCPSSAPVRAYAVRIAQETIAYDRRTRDSVGIAFQLDEGTPPLASPGVTEPLVLRVNAGECLEVTLRNLTIERASFNVASLTFDLQGSYGAAVGFNADSSVAPGEQRLYRYFAQQELTTGLVYNLAAPGSGARGAYAAVVVEPAGSVWRDPRTGAERATGIVADILSPTRRFREAVLLFADEDPIIGQSEMPYPIKVKGFTGISYSAAPFDRRNADSDPSRVFDSRLHGDPRLVVEAHAGDPVLLRVGQPFGEQPHVFSIDGHLMRSNEVLGGERFYARNLGPAVTFNAELVGGAGGALQAPGDYLIADERAPFTEAGLWGILRVHPAGSTKLLPLTPSPGGATPGSGAGTSVGDGGTMSDAGVPDMSGSDALDAGSPTPSEKQGEPRAGTAAADPDGGGAEEGIAATGSDVPGESGGFGCAAAGAADRSGGRAMLALGLFALAWRLRQRPRTSVAARTGRRDEPSRPDFRRSGPNASGRSARPARWRSPGLDRR